jgi:2-keto-3-deoxy-L-rhamnonate aldolase RhmA
MEVFMTLKEKLLSGKKIYGCMIRVVRNPAICLIARHAGLDFIMFDCEHSNYTPETLHDVFIQANSAGLGGFLRATSLSKDNISRPLDQGATGVMIPMTETEEQAKEIVKWSKYQPVGERGYCTGTGMVAYKSGISHVETMEDYGNKRVISIAQVETKLAVDNADKIAAVNGIDALLIGPNDLSLSLGIPGDLMNPIELDAIRHVISACKKHGKAFGIHAGPKMIELFINDLTLVMMQGDTDVLSAGFKNINDTLRKLAGE